MSPRQPLDIPGLLGILLGAFIIAAGLNDPLDPKYCADCSGGLITLVMGAAYSYFGPWGARAILIAGGVLLIATSWRSRWNPGSLPKRPAEIAKAGSSLHSNRAGRALVLIATLLLMTPGVVAAYQLAKGETLLGFAIGGPWLAVYTAVCVFNHRRGGLRLRTSLGGAALLVGGVGLLTAIGGAY